MIYVCYLLEPESGGTYVGATGLPLFKRLAQHRRERFPDIARVTILATAISRAEINHVEERMVIALHPSLNRRRGGTSVEGFRHGQGRKRQPRRLTFNIKAEARRGRPLADPNFCAHGHWWDDGHRLTANGSKVCRKCDRLRDERRRLQP